MGVARGTQIVLALGCGLLLIAHMAVDILNRASSRQTIRIQCSRGLRAFCLRTGLMGFLLYWDGWWPRVTGRQGNWARTGMVLVRQGDRCWGLGRWLLLWMLVPWHVWMVAWAGKRRRKAAVTEDELFNDMELSEALDSIGIRGRGRQWGDDLHHGLHRRDNDDDDNYEGAYRARHGSSRRTRSHVPRSSHDPRRTHFSQPERARSMSPVRPDRPAARAPTVGPGNVQYSDVTAQDRAPVIQLLSNYVEEASYLRPCERDRDTVAVMLPKAQFYTRYNDSYDGYMSVGDKNEDHDYWRLQHIHPERTFNPDNEFAPLTPVYERDPNTAQYSHSCRFPRKIGRDGKPKEHPSHGTHDIQNDCVIS